MGTSEPSRIVVRGRDLCDDLIGRVDFGEMTFLEVAGRLPTKAEGAMLNAALVTLAEHGITANSLATRLTYLAAPESLQGSVAAGLLGAGSVYLGAVEGSARVLQRLALPTPDAQAAAIRDYVADVHEAGERIPGVGHPLHKPVDPRTERLFTMADDLQLAAKHRDVARALQEEAERTFGRILPLNADGGIAAILSDLGFPWQICRGFAVIARSVGLVGHISDEIERPQARRLWEIAEERIPYSDPDPASFVGGQLDE